MERLLITSLANFYDRKKSRTYHQLTVVPKTRLQVGLEKLAKLSTSQDRKGSNIEKTRTV